MGALDSLLFATLRNGKKVICGEEKKIKTKNEDLDHFSSGQQYQIIVVHSKY